MSFFRRTHHDEPDTDEENDDTIDPELRLRTVRTAASAISESIRTEQRAEKRRSMHKRSRFFRRHDKKPGTTPSTLTTGSTTAIQGARRNVYVNHPLSAIESTHDGEPIAQYCRNKVRTTKYTILTFVPKNLYEQFRRVANLFFLSLVIVQVFPVFGAAAGNIAVLPLAFILTVTAIKDGIEDYRRGTLDEEVNTSAVTKLGGGWRNVNQPSDPRSWFEKLLGINPPGKVSKGVRKLRDKEASAAGKDLRRIVLTKGGDDASSVLTHDVSASSLDLAGRTSAGGRRLEDIHSIDSHSYPPTMVNPNDPSKTSLSAEGGPSSSSSSQPVQSPPAPGAEWGQLGGLSQYQQSLRSQSTVAGVIDWRKRTPGSARWERTLWKKLEVGDIVLLHENEQVPADIVVLSTSDPDNMCYLETKNLDGETNLKPRQSVRATSEMTSEDDVERSCFYLDSEPPHQNLYSYHGVLNFKDLTSGESRQEAVSINQLLLRGCALRNTAWVIGLVVFTGADTKIMMNGGDTPSKRSKIEKETNFNVLVNFALLTLMCLIGAIFSGLEDAKTGTSAQFFEQNSDPTNSFIINALVTFVSCLIAFQNIVPISLYISIEIVKTIQAYFISQDLDMYYEPYDTACVPKTWNISDDLGQIEYIFSDKTGTLTQNVMEFQRCSINGVAYGEGITEAQRGAATRAGNTGEILNPKEMTAKLEKLKKTMIQTLERTFKNRYMQKDKLTLVSPKFAEDLAEPPVTSAETPQQRKRIAAFFRALALCHSVLADKPEPQAKPHFVQYKAESPDEAALVAAARDVGFPFVSKSKDTLEIEVMGQVEKYTLLKMIEFNSTRKRMSVILRCPDGKLVLYCKGADSVIYERLAKDHDLELKEQTAKDMEAFANSGLRTLCIAWRPIEEEEYLRWSKTYDDATNAVEGREEEIDKACALIEHSLLILGATALEDKLQEGVPEAIEMLHRAGIKLWILTGDKLQTAIEIGYSCNLLKNSMDVMILSAATPEQARAQIEAGLNKIASVLGPPRWDSPRTRGFVPGAQASFAVVIDGETLRYALTDELKPLFLNLGTQCETVVCCRVSPAQKALTVNLVKEGRNAMTLSIGDGANDVAMIQEANIGCGLFGLEGSQAAMSADYAFGQFRFLTKLLLVHGRWSYQRVADMHSNFFYKNVIWTFALFWFLPFNGFDATYLYQYTFILLYNLVFTSLPVIVLGAFDQDINAKAALAYPQLYVRGIRGLEYTRTKFWMYMTDGLYQSGVVFFIPYLVWTLGSPISWTGRTIESLADFGTTVAVSAIVAANTYVGLNTHYWTIMTWIVVVGSSLVMMLWIVVYSFFESSDFVDEVSILFSTLEFWTTVILVTLICLAPRFIVKYWSTSYHPLDKDIVREMWVMGDLKDQLGISHRKNRKKRRDNSDNDIMMLESGNRSGRVRSGDTLEMEAAPMFTEEAHTRSVSELTSGGGAGGHDSSSGSGSGTPSSAGSKTHHGPGEPPLPKNYLDASPHSGNIDLPPSGPIQYARVPTNPYSSTNNLNTPTTTAPYQQDRLSPLPPHGGVDYHTRHTHSVSPQPSYYSASDIPPPSPLPQPTYRYPSGEITTIAPPSGASRRGSLASRVTSGAGGVGVGAYSAYSQPLPSAGSSSSGPSKRLSMGLGGTGAGGAGVVIVPSGPTSPSSPSPTPPLGPSIPFSNPHSHPHPSPPLMSSAPGTTTTTHAGSGTELLYAAIHPKDRSGASEASHASFSTAADEFNWESARSSPAPYSAGSASGGGYHQHQYQQHQNPSNNNNQPAMLRVVDLSDDGYNNGHSRNPSASTWEGGRAL